jgi:hypothetical protein
MSNDFTSHRFYLEEMPQYNGSSTTQESCRGHNELQETLDELRSSEPWIFQFLGILCALNPLHLHEPIFLRVFHDPPRWGARGEITSVRRSTFNLEIEVFQNCSRFQEALERITMLGVLSNANGIIPNTKQFQINERVHQCMESYREMDDFKIQAVRFISFVFPRVLELEPL